MRTQTQTRRKNGMEVEKRIQIPKLEVLYVQHCGVVKTMHTEEPFSKTATAINQIVHYFRKYSIEYASLFVFQIFDLIIHSLYHFKSRFYFKICHRY